MVAENDILKSLSRIIDPDFNKDIVSLGFVRNIKINGKEVSFEIALTTPACPIKEEFQGKAEQVVKEIPGVESVKVHMTTLQKQTPFMQGTQTLLSKVGDIIAVSSCKGGVGKSTIAAHLAQELAQRGYRVGLVDTDIYGPSIPTLFNLQNKTVYANEKQQLIPLEQNNLKIMSFGFLLGDAPAVIRGPIVTRYVQQVLFNTAWGELDYLFIDMPPGTGDVQLTITQSVRLSGAVIVTTPQTLSLLDVARGILMFEKVSVPILGLIENMSYFLCDHCSKKHYIFGTSTSKKLEERFGIETLAELPLLSEMAINMNQSVGKEYIRQAVNKVVMALGKSRIQKKEIPTIAFDQDYIQLAWPDGTKMSVQNRELRLSCRCALCVNELTGEKTLKENDIKPDIAPTKISPLGNYAIGIEWNDGHASGIYPYNNIKEIAKVSAA